jgi:hypothetical protein
MRELEAQALALAPVIASAIAKAVAPLQEALAAKDAAIVALSKRLDELPVAAEPDLDAIAKLVVVPEPVAGKDADPVDLDALARAAAALVPVPEAKQPEHGRDALDLEILPAIDDAKQYPRGTYAAHNGGLWKSYERTHGMRGWECIVDGIAAASVAQVDAREFSVKLVKSSGAEEVQTFCLPIQIYKGVHREGEVYDEHDNVTWAGSQWTSTKTDNADKPGSSDAWQLTVKAGRPGKDLRENASNFDASKGLKL